MKFPHTGSLVQNVAQLGRQVAEMDFVITLMQ